MVRPKRVGWIKELRLRHYRAFEDTRLELEKLTVVVGKNGSGKSTLLDALGFLEEAASDSLLVALERRGGLAGIRQRQRGAARRYDVSVAVLMAWGWTEVLYGFKLGSARSGNGYSVKQEVLKASTGDCDFKRTAKTFKTDIGKTVRPALDSESLVLPVIAGQDSRWQAVLESLRGLRTYTLDPAALLSETSIEKGRWLSPDGGNAANILKDLERSASGQNAIRAIVERLALVVPGIVNLSSRTSGDRRYLQVHQAPSGEHTEVYGGTAVSDGTWRSLGVLLALRQENNPSLTAIDEIEDSIHPAALSVLLDASDAAAKDFSVLLTSHSPEVLSHPAIQGKNVRVVQWSEGVSNVFPLSDGTMGILKPPTSAGKLLRSNALWPSDKPQTNARGFFG